MTVNPVAKYVKTDYTGQTGTQYKTNIDANNVVAMRFADNFAARAQDTPDMTVHVDAGHLFDGATLTEVAAQNTGTITAPSGSNKRIDRVVIDNITGTVSVVTGTPTTGTPVAPAIPAGKTPLAQIGTTGSPLVVGTTTITNAIIVDERNLNSAGTGFNLPDSVSGASYTFLTSDHKKVKFRSNSGSAMTDSLPQAGSTFPAGWWCEVINTDASAPLTITPTTSTIDGATATTIKAGRSAKIVSDGSNYRTERGSHGALGPITNVVSGATVDLGLSLSNYLNVTGVTGITSFGSAASVAFPFYILKFSGILTITSGANLNVHGGNYTTAAGDYGIAFVTASGTWDFIPLPKDGRYLKAFTGDSGSGGSMGLVPAPSAGDAAAGKVIGAGGVWVTPTSGATGNIQTFNSSGTWTKPPTGTIARIQIWGAGAGGGRSSSSFEGGGGGGGGYNEIWIPVSSLGATETVTIGGGGAGASNGSGGVGGNSTFGSWLTGFGGGGGGTIAGSGGGGGGTNSTGTSGGSGATGGAGGGPGGGPGGTSSALPGDSVSGGGGGSGSFSPHNGANGFWGGGGGGSGGGPGGGGGSVWGGGGGCGANTSTGGSAGQSVYGGGGGTRQASGTAPGGGGGGGGNSTAGAGAAGQCIVTVF